MHWAMGNRMTVFDFDKEDSGAWFDMDGGGRIHLKIITPADWIRIRKASTIKSDPVVKKVEGGRYQLFEREVFDEDLQREMVNDTMILDWEGLFDGKERPIPCTKENKLRLMMMRDSRFRDFVNDKMAVLEKLKQDQKEAEEKN
jgi:hypothetical protein